MRSRSIREYLLLSWVILLGSAVLSSTLLSLAISYLDYSNYRQSLVQKLHHDGALIARRLAAELLLKEHGRTSAVLESLKVEYGFSEIALSNETDSVPANGNGKLVVHETIPGVSPQTFVRVAAPSKGFREFISFRNTLFALVPIFGLVLFGFLIQRYFLRRYILRPIEALADTSVGAKPVRDHWPREFQKIASDLSDSFSNREQAVFGQLARGLVHDIRTHINSISTALQLVQETKSQSERIPRLEKLEGACGRNVPKIRELLDLSLDSSREIVIKPKSDDLSQTLQQSVQNIQDLADSKGVSVIANALESLKLAHDRVQMERVFTNLIKNAVEAAEGSQSEKAYVEITADLVDEGLRVCIEDNGPGFPDYRQAFRPLKTTKAHGYGLGLFVSRKIVQAHRGVLDASASSRLGGAKITITLPREEIRA